MMPTSDSGQHSGWADYPGEVWDERKPIGWLYDWPFWAECATNYANKLPILELACGNGRITRQLALAGYTVVAVDINPHFLSRATAQIRTLPDDMGIRVEFYLQDMVHLKLGRQFALALMADWAFPALLNQADQLSFLRRLADHLIPNGYFVFDTIFPGVRELGLTPGIEGECLEWSGTGRTFNPISQIETLISGGQVMQYRHTSLSEIRLLAEMTGFEVAECFGGTDRRPLRGMPGDDLTVVLRKKIKRYD
ncbi:MAG: class I SAM-dependent methyltransferase [Chloroflexi bacterium]|nr:class I SAM-dependent methyltransferase [Chloroflexota bacterium]